MIAFFIATPFQLMNAVCILESNYPGEQADLFIRGNCAHKQLIADIEKYKNYFSEVILMNAPAYHGSLIHFFLEFLFPKRSSIKRLTEHSYTDMFISREGGEADFYYTHLRKKNHDIRFNYIDDGIGEYYLEIEHKNLKRNRIIMLWGYKNPYKFVHKLWLWQPTLRFANMQYSCEKIQSPSPNTAAILEKMYGVGDDLKLPDDCKLIYMDQPFLKQQNFDVDDRKMLDIISSVVPKENIYVKIHPGTDNTSRYDGYKVLPDLGCPWELAQCLINTSNLILVAVNSTAVVTPKTIFDKEPCVMLLYDMFKDKPFINIDKQRMYFSGVKGLYNDESRFIMPQSEDEITDFLKKEMLSL